VTRKAILDVDVKKACKTIMEPEAPLALRLQGSLLLVLLSMSFFSHAGGTCGQMLTLHSYGVSRVHYQQWEYLLSDAQAAQNNMRTLLRAVRNNELDPEAGKAR